MWGKMATMPYVLAEPNTKELASHSFSFNSLFQDNNARIHTQGTAAGPAPQQAENIIIT